MNRDSPHSTDSSRGSENRLVHAAWAQFEQIKRASRRAGIASAGAARVFSVPGYRILGEIHRGGQGVVYQAIQESTNRKIALKVLKGGPFADRIELARFEREVDVLGRLAHPHIVAIHDRGLTEGHAYFVMDYIAGSPLDAHIAGAELSIDEILGLFAKVCDAVHVAHLRGVIHRDLKPGNIRVDLDGEPRILDFGLAKLALESAGSSADGMTVTGQFVGSLPWASPEQATGGTDGLDIRTDIYSLGVILYQLLTARFPYPVTGRIDDVVRNIVQTSPARPSTVRRGLDHDLELIVLKSLAKEPEHRYQSAGDLARDIRHYLAHEPVTATSPSASYRLRKFVRRNRGGVIAGAVVAMSLLICSGVSLAFGLSEARQRRAAEIAMARAQTAEADTKARAGELEQVAQFQQAQLSGIDAKTMGARLRSELLKRARDTAERTRLPPGELSARDAALEKLIAGTDFTGLALDALDENVFKRALKSIEKQFSSQPLVKARMLQALASTMQHVGLLDAAVEPQKEAVAIRQRALGDDHPDTLASLNEIATLLHAQGKLAEAERYYRQVLDLRRRVLGEDNPHTLTSIRNLGVVLLDQGKLVEAEAYCREALGRFRRVLGDDHPDTLASIYDMGRLLHSQGKVAEAEQHLREALEKRRRVLGDDHPDTLNSIAELAGALRNGGNLTEAEQYLREAVEKSRQVLGDDHPDTLSSINGLGVLLESQGRLSEAETFYHEALDRRRRVLGDEHVDTLASLMSMGSVYKAEGKLEEAEPYLRESLEKFRRVLGNEHPLTLKAIGNMGLLLKAQGRLAEAEAYYREALEKRRLLLGNEHPDTLTTIHNLGVLLVTEGKLADAEPLCREAMEKGREVLGDENPATLASIGSMGSLLLAQGKPAEAEPFCRESVDKRRRVLGDEHPETLIGIGILGAALQAQGKATKAIALLAPFEAATRQAFTGGNAVRLGRFLSALGRARAATGEFDAAAANLMEAHTILTKAKGTTDRDRAEVLNGLVQLYDAWHTAEPDKGHDAKASEWRAKLAELQTKQRELAFPAKTD